MLAQVFVFFFFVFRVVDVLLGVTADEDAAFGVDEEGMAAEADAVVGAAHIDGAEIHAVFDGAGADEDFPLLDVNERPGRRDEDERRAAFGHLSK